MPDAPLVELPTPLAILDQVRSLRRHNDWTGIALLADHLPTPFDAEWLEVADAISFAFGQLRQWKVAIALVEHCFAIEPTWRRASAAAYWVQIHHERRVAVKMLTTEAQRPQRLTGLS